MGETGAAALQVEFDAAHNKAIRAEANAIVDNTFLAPAAHEPRQTPARRRAKRAHGRRELDARTYFDVGDAGAQLPLMTTWLNWVGDTETKTRWPWEGACRCPTHMS